MFKRIFYQALLSAVLCALAGFIYNRIYFFATEADFSKVINWKSLIALSFLSCFAAAFLYWAVSALPVRWAGIVFNFLLSILSFAAVMIPISLTLPLDVKFPELFPGLGVPMVFFPAMAWYTVAPLFSRKR